MCFECVCLMFAISLAIVYSRSQSKTPRHVSDVYTRFHLVYNRRAKGGESPLNPLMQPRSTNMAKAPEKEPLRVMKEKTPKTSKTTVVFSLRVSEEDAGLYDAMCKDASLNRSELLRAIIKTKTNGGGVVINAPQKKQKDPDYSKLIFYYNKASNNINQVAKKINSAFAANIISENTMLSGIAVLQNIERLLEAGLDNGYRKG